MRKTELSKRKKEILKEVIDLFIETGEPVGSKALMQRLSTSVSSATIRNEMNDLEKLGFLEQPHTSAGRVPTSRGYRIYVNSLMENTRLSFQETLLLNSLLSDKLKETEYFLSDMASLLAKMTGYTVVAFAKEKMGTIERFEGIFINPGSFLLVMLTSSGKAIAKQLQVDFPIQAENVSFLISVLNSHLAKKELGGVTLERMIALERELGELRVLIAPLIQIIYQVMEQIGRENIQVRGMSNLAGFREFSNPKKLSEILEELEDEEALLSRFRQDYTSGLRVHIAGEGKGLDGTSFVVCPFRWKRNLEGAVCIIGPGRMDYGKAMAGLEYLAKQIRGMNEFVSFVPLIEDTKGE